jgi:urease accessory protein
MNVRRSLFLASILLAALPGVAEAHTGHGAVFSFSSGFLHPFGGLDHVLAMIAVGLLAAQLGSRALWLVPGTFVTVMALAAAAGVVGVSLPGTEYGILISIIAISLPVALALGMPVTLAMTLVGAFAIFHGHAHGAELPAGAEVAPYIAGFALATALIHAAGISFGLALGRLAAGSPALRIAGGAIALAGCILAAV